MAGGYPVNNPDPLGPLLDLIRGVQTRLAQLEKPTGTSLSSLYAQVQAALANIDQKVQDSIAANSYTKAQIDAKIASPGNISPGTVNASGNVSGANLSTGGTVTAGGGGVSSAGPVSGSSFSTGGTMTSQGVVVSPGSHNFNVTTGYVAAWINGDGTFGTSASSREVKRDLVPLRKDAVANLLQLPTYHGRYIWDADDAPHKAFLLAEDVAAAGISDDLVATIETDDGSSLLVLNHALLVVPLLAAVQQLAARIDVLEAK